jgi:hypothetical protein
VSGVAATSLVVLAPVREDASERLRTALAALDEAPESPFALVPGTHFARFALVPALTGPRDVRYMEPGPLLLMCADFDTSTAVWAASVCERTGGALAATLACWAGFPGTGDAEAVAEFFALHNAAPGFTVAGHRRATVDEIRAALTLKRELRSLAVRAQVERLDPGALRDAWHAVARP